MNKWFQAMRQKCKSFPAYFYQISLEFNVHEHECLLTSPRWLRQLHIFLVCCVVIELDGILVLSIHTFFNFQIELYTWINHVHRYHTYTKVASQHTFNPIFLLIVYTEIKAFESLQYPSHLHKCVYEHCTIQVYMLMQAISTATVGMFGMFMYPIYNSQPSNECAVLSVALAVTPSTVQVVHTGWHQIQ